MTTLMLGGLAFLITLGVTPLIMRLARRLKIVDQPDGHRKLHVSAMPLGGGTAIWIGFLLTLFAGGVYGYASGIDLFPHSRFLAALILAASTICIVGLTDDRFELRGRHKLLGQILAVSILVAAGFVIENVNVLGWHIQLGLLALPFTYFWMLGAINALNLIDGMDGLASTVGIVLSAAMAIMAALSGHASESLLAVIMLGCLAGFLPFNFPPARIYLGDAGSMLIGLILGALAIRGSLKGPATVALAAPMAIWAILIFDVGMAVLRRKLTGQSLYTSDRGHLHHCLLRKGYGNKKALAWIGGLCALTAGGALVGVYQKSELLGLGCVGVVLGTLIVTRFFGHAECHLLYRRVAGLFHSMLPALRPAVQRGGEFRARLDGTREWEELWQSLIEFADRFDMVAVKLNVSLPALREEYHAHWTRKGTANVRRLWSAEVPLVAQNMTVGRLQISGSCPEDGVCDWMGELISGLKPVEARVSEILDDECADARTPFEPANPLEPPVFATATSSGRQILQGSEL